jgi:hypothetical protein
MRMAKKTNGISINERLKSKEKGIFAIETTVNNHRKYATKAGHLVTGVETTIKMKAIAEMIFKWDGNE